jgi:UDP-glucose 4-epimerase
MNILITGGAGYIGTALTHILTSKPEVSSITLYDNLSRPNYNLFSGVPLPSESRVKFVKGELLDNRKLRKALSGIDVVVHLAAQVSTPFSDTNHHLFEQVNHWGTSGLIDAVEESDVKRVVYMSSTSVYGSGDEVFTIESEPEPKTIYGSAKYRGEQQVLRTKRDVEFAILRCGNVFGFSPGLRYDAVINRFMFEANFSNHITIQGSGKQHRAFVHIDNVCKALWQSISNTSIQGTYNLVEANYEILEIAETLQGLYPELETLFVNPHLHLRQLKVEALKEDHAILDIQLSSLPDYLSEFKTKFAF